METLCLVIEQTEDLSLLTDGELTLSRLLATLRTFFEFLAAEEPDRSWPNPVNWRRHGIKEGEPLPRDLSDADVERLFAAIDDDRDRAMFGSMVGAGVRVSELVNLRLADVDLAGGRLIVRGGKNKRDRVVYLTPTLTRVLKTHLAYRETGDDDHLWLDDGKPSKAAQVCYRLRRWGEQYDVAVTPHRLRHTLATRLINQSMSLEALRKLLGHKTLRMTQRCAHLHDVTVRERFQTAMDNVEGIAVSDWPQPESIFTGVNLPVMLKTDSV